MTSINISTKFAVETYNSKDSLIVFCYFWILYDRLEHPIMKKRIEWIDQVKGFAIFLVVYGHNFPFLEKYIYSFHMPLFFIIAGFFHPIKQNKVSIKKRINQLIVPYFLWSFLLFIFWLFLGGFMVVVQNITYLQLKIL